MTTRYQQFCALARAIEILGERWTLLIVRELLLGPKRFVDLRGRLDGVSTSVLAERLSRLEEMQIVRRSVLAPPAASTVYELTDSGRALEPAVFALIRWGARFLLPRRPGERLEPEWMRLVLAAYARKTRTPARSFEIRMPAAGKPVAMRVVGGRRGTTVLEGESPVDLIITAPAEAVLGLMSGRLDPSDALRLGHIQAEGDQTALSIFSQLFDVDAGPGGRSARP